MGNVKCPNCGVSYFQECYTISTAMYSPSVYRNGRYINTDRNIHSHSCICLNCGTHFVFKTRGGELLDD